MTTTPQSQARSWLRWIARHWSAARIADLPVYSDEPCLGEDAYYRGPHETDLYMSEYIYVDTSRQTATLTVRWYLARDADAYQAVDAGDDPVYDYGDVCMEYTSRIAATHRERVAAGVRAALAMDEERGSDWSGVTVR